jgi:hypothetical protein
MANVTSRKFVPAVLVFRQYTRTDAADRRAVDVLPKLGGGGRNPGLALIEILCRFED